MLLLLPHHHLALGRSWSAGAAAATAAGLILVVSYCNTHHTASGSFESYHYGLGFVVRLMP